MATISMGRDYDGEKKRDEKLKLTTVRGVPAGKSVRFVRDDKMKIAERKMQGYHFPDASEKAGIDVPAGSVEADGQIHLGDTILMLVETKRLEENRKEHDELVAHRRQAVKSDVHRVGRELGVQTFDAREDDETRDK